MEQNYYNNYNNNYGEQQVPQIPQAQQMQPYMAQPQQEMPKKKKNHKFAQAAAIIAAVAIVGGGAGFGGAYLASGITASRGTSAETSSSSVTDKTPVESGSGTSNGGRNSSGDDISGALNALNNSASSEITKTYAKDVTATGENGEYTLEELYEAVNDTIVFINVYTTSNESDYSYYDSFFFGNRNSTPKSTEPTLTGCASGVMFTEDGYILTNNHVVEGASKLTVEVNDYYDPEVTHEYEATVIGSDPSTDIAVIKISDDEPFIAANIGNSDTLKVGQQVAAIGNPGVSSTYLFKHTMTSGIVSGLDVTCLADDGYSTSLIQTDAAINFGNSGGGLFDMHGNIVGIVNSKITATNFEGIGFAITINEVKPVVEDLLTYGYVKSRPVLGITTIPLNEYRAELYGTKLSQGLLVASVNENAPVSQSGLTVGDIITKINGQNVTSVEDVQKIISNFKVGDKVTATVARVNSSNGLDSIDIDIILTESSN